MKRRQKRQWKGYFRVYRPMSSRHGAVMASIYGVIENYCDMSSKVCTVSHETIGMILNLHRNTIIYYIKKLIKDGYIVDLTPNVRNHPHAYRMTNKLFQEVKTMEDTEIDHETSTVLSESDKQGEPETHVDVIDCDDSSEIAAQELVSNFCAPESLLPNSATPLPNFIAARCTEIAQPAAQNLCMKKNIKELKTENTEKDISISESEEKNKQTPGFTPPLDPEMVWSQVLEKLLLHSFTAGMKMPEWVVQGWEGRSLKISSTIDPNRHFMEELIQPTADQLIREVTNCPDARVAFNNEEFMKQYRKWMEEEA